MRVLLQRVTSATVSIEDEVTGSIGPGLMVLVGVGPDDTADIATAILGLLARDAVPGRYHVVNSGGGVSWFEFARAIIEAAGVDAVEVAGERDRARHGQPAGLPDPRPARLRHADPRQVGVRALFL